MIEVVSRTAASEASVLRVRSLVVDGDGMVRDTAGVVLRARRVRKRGHTGRAARTASDLHILYNYI